MRWGGQGVGERAAQRIRERERSFGTGGGERGRENRFVSMKGRCVRFPRPVGSGGGGGGGLPVNKRRWRPEGGGGGGGGGGKKVMETVS